MQKYLLSCITVLLSFAAMAQDFSNKGKDFWVAYGYHQQMTNGGGGGSQDMVLYFATDQVTNITITIPGIPYTVQTITTSPGNNVITSTVIPKTGVNDARLTVEGLSNKGIHITSDRPMVAYAHVYNQSVSGATILFPTNTLGKEYYSVNYKNWSNSPNSYCWFYVVAADTGTTTIEITPSDSTMGGWLGGFTHTVTLTQGQVYNVMGKLTASPTNCNPVCKGVDLTGSTIKSINTGTGCKKIAVFSGSGRISITCNNNSSSSDNYMVQAMPKTAWGKKYLTTQALGVVDAGHPLGNESFNFYRVCVSNPATVVKVNGVITALPLQNNFYYEIPATNQPQLIEGDSAIMVAQYFTSQGACGNGNPGDPEMIYLSPVEQNINRVLWNATSNYQITAHYINIVIPNSGTALSSFTLDGSPTIGFIVHPQDNNYRYLRRSVTPGFHIIQSDSGFNAIAYGFGGAESYGYNAGTNIKDLYQQIGVASQYGIETSPSVCTNSPFKFKVSLPYIPDSMYWNFHNAANMLPNNNNVMVHNIPVNSEDSSTVVNGKTIHWYSLPTYYNFTAVGTYPITITTYVPNNDCGSVQDIDFDLTVNAPPIGDFSFGGSGCVAEAYQFTETTPQVPKPTYHFWWDFGDPGSGASNSSAVRNPTHTFSAPGTYNVRFADITTPGCLSDTIVHQVIVPALPSATISGTTSVCINAAAPLVTFTATDGTAPYTFTYHINGGGQLTVNSVAGNTATVSAPTNVAGVFVYTLDSVKNTGSILCTQPITGQTATITVLPDHTITLTSPGATTNQTVCINTAIVPIVYTLGGGATGATITGLPPGVTFAVSGNTLTISGAPTSGAGSPYNYSITTTGNACVTASAIGSITVNVNHTIVLASASADQTVCINTPITPIAYTLGGGATGGTVTGLPAGITSSVAGNTLTISGTPTTTIGSPFNYTITTTGNTCITASAGGTITVLADHTIVLSSPPATANQTVCINTAITSIVYTLGGGATGATITGLPPGVTYVVTGNTLTITGSPTSGAGSPYNFSITTTGNACITSSAIGSITVSPDHTILLTSAAATTNQTVCNNSPITPITYDIGGGATGVTVTGLPAGVTSSLAGNTLTISGTPTTTTGSPFNYSITTTGNACITASASGTITVRPLPTGNFNYTAPSCETRTITFTDASVANLGVLNSWSWDFGDPASGASNTSSLQNPTHSFATAGSYIVKLIVSSTSTCISNSFQRTVVINARPQAGYIIPEVCLSDTYAQFTDTSKISAGTIVAWAWNFGDPVSGVNNTSTLQNPQHSYSAVGNYQVQLIVTSNIGCKDTIVQTLTVNGSFPKAGFNVNNSANLCANDSVAIVNTSTVFPGTITKVEIWWDDVNAGPPGPPFLDNFPYPNKVYKHLYPNFQAPLTKAYRIRFRAYSGGVCLNDTLGNITIHAAPKVQFNPIPDTCLLVNPFQIPIPANGGVPGSGVFSGPGITSAGIFSPAIAGVGIHTILYTYTSSAGNCVDTMSRTINVIDTAQAIFTWGAPICDGVPGSFTDQSIAPAGVTLANTIWDFGDGSPVQNHLPGSTFTHLFPGANTYTVKMYNVSAFGCTSTVYSQLVTVDPNHTILLTSGAGSNNQIVCINTPITPITYTLGGGATGATITGLPAGVTYSVTGTTLTISGSPTVTAGSPYNYSITTTGNTCITATASGTIAISSNHTLTLTSASTTTDQRVCLNTPIVDITYTLGGGATGVNITGLPPGVSYLVSGNILTISGSPGSTAGTPYNYSIITTGNNCVKATDIGVIKVSPYPVPGFDFDKPSYCIPNATVIFNNSSTIEDGTENAFTYLWDFADPGSGSNNNSFAKNPSHYYTSTGPFNVKLVVTSGFGCSNQIIVPLTTIHPQQKAKFGSNQSSICIGDVVIFEDQTVGVSQHWDFGDGQTGSGSPISHLYLKDSTYIVSLYIIDNNGCNSDTLPKPFTVYPYPVVDAGPDRVVLEGSMITLNATASGNDLQYLWTPNLYMVNNTVEKPTIDNILNDITYTFTVTARGGCAKSDLVFIKLLKTPKIPNTFTPNHDNINDTWKIASLDAYPNCLVQVFSRTGQLVFESRGIYKPWDGTLKGKPLPFDTYYYIIEPNEGREPIKGYVTIVK